MAYIDIHDQPGEHRTYFNFPARALADGDFTDEFPIFHAPFRSSIRFVQIVLGAGGLGGGGNFTSVRIIDKGADGTGSTALETFSFAAGGDEFQNYAVYSPDPVDAVAAGTVLSISYVLGGGAGEAMPPIFGFVEFEGS